MFVPTRAQKLFDKKFLPNNRRTDVWCDIDSIDWIKMKETSKKNKYHTILSFKMYR